MISWISIVVVIGGEEGEVVVGLILLLMLLVTIAGLILILADDELPLLNANGWSKDDDGDRPAAATVSFLIESPSSSSNSISFVASKLALISFRGVGENISLSSISSSLLLGFFGERERERKLIVLK